MALEESPEEVKPAPSPAERLSTALQNIPEKWQAALPIGEDAPAAPATLIPGVPDAVAFNLAGLGVPADKGTVITTGRGWPGLKVGDATFVWEPDGSSVHLYKDCPVCKKAGKDAGVRSAAIGSKGYLGLILRNGFRIHDHEPKG